MFKDNPFMRRLFGGVTQKASPEPAPQQEERPEFLATICTVRPPIRYTLWQLAPGGYRVIIPTIEQQELIEVLATITDKYVNVPRPWKICPNQTHPHLFDIKYYTAVRTDHCYNTIAAGLLSIESAMRIIQVRTKRPNVMDPPPPPPQPHLRRY